MRILYKHSQSRKMYYELVTLTSVTFFFHSYSYFCINRKKCFLRSHIYTGTPIVQGQLIQSYECISQIKHVSYSELIYSCTWRLYSYSFWKQFFKFLPLQYFYKNYCHIKSKLPNRHSDTTKRFTVYNKTLSIFLLHITCS